MNHTPYVYRGDPMVDATGEKHEFSKNRIAYENLRENTRYRITTLFGDFNTYDATFNGYNASGLATFRDIVNARKDTVRYMSNEEALRNGIKKDNIVAIHEAPREGLAHNLTVARYINEFPLPTEMKKEIGDYYGLGNYGELPYSITRNKPWPSLLTRTHVGDMFKKQIDREYEKAKAKANENRKTKRIKNYGGRNYKPKHRKSSKHGRKSLRKMSRNTRRRKT